MLLLNGLVIKHLFKLDQAKGFYVTTYDVYPQNPGFAQANFHDQTAHEKLRAQEGSLFKLFTNEARRTLKYGLPGNRSNVPTVVQIDKAVEKLLRQQADGPQAKVA